MAREWTIWFLGSLFFLLGTLLLFSSIEDLGRVFPRGFDFWLDDFWFWLLSYLPWLLPICCLGASIFSLSFVRKRGEWTAMLANGISPIQSFSLIVLLGLGVGLSSNWLVRAAGENSMSLSDLKTRTLEMHIGSKRLWYFRSFDPSTGIGQDVQLFRYGDDGENVMRIRAAQAKWESDHGWTFYNGRFLGFYSALGLPVIDKSGNSVVWEKIDEVSKNDEIYQTKSPGISRSFEKLYGLDLPDNPTPYLWLQKRAKDMSVGEIERLLDRFPYSKGLEMIPYQLRKAQLWWNGPACLVALLIGLGLGSARGAAAPAKIAGVALLGALGFYLVRTLSDSLGEQQILNPMVAASLPYILIVLATFIFLKMQK